MIVRYGTTCPGCEYKIDLRLQVGYEQEQSFYYVCERCGAPTRGLLKAIPDPQFPKIDLELEDGPVLDSHLDGADQIITISLDFPCLIQAEIEDPEKYFPFFLQGQLMGGMEKVLEFQRRVAMYRGLIEEDWPRIRRIFVYYLDREWDAFDSEVAKILDEEPDQTDATDLTRHDGLQRLLEVIFISLLPSDEYLKLKAEINGLFNQLLTNSPDQLREFVVLATDSDELHQDQRRLLERLEFIVGNFGALSAGFPILLYESEADDRIEDLRIMRDDFELLKVHYLSSFESLHHVLRLPVGLVNIGIRGDHDAFGQKGPQSLGRFSSLPNAQKPQYLDGNIVPVARAVWDKWLDRQLRNAIGHNSIHHDLGSGMLMRTNGDPISYSSFVANTFYHLTLVLYALQIVKMFYIHRWFYDQGLKS